jgi:hypothetical protein
LKDRANVRRKTTAAVIVAVVACLVVLSNLIVAPAGAAVTWTAKTVGQLFPPDGRGCFFFTLEGVTEADPALPSSYWFAIPITYQGYKELVSLLYLDKATGTTINVVTSGTTACGFSTIQYAYSN